MRSAIGRRAVLVVFTAILIAVVAGPSAAQTVIPNTRDEKPTAGAKPADAPWSEPVDGLQARIALKRSEVMNGTPIIAVSLELKNVGDLGSPMKLAWSSEPMKFRVVDAEGKELPTYNTMYDGMSPFPFDLTLPHASTLVFDISSHGAGIPANQAALIDLEPMRCWEIPRDGKDYYLQATLEISEAQAKHEGEWRIWWHGRLDLPKVQIPLKAEPLDPATLGQRIDDLGARMLGMGGKGTGNAARELSLIDDERVIPWYLKAMATNDYGLKFAALDRLCQFKSDTALGGIKKGLTTQGADIGNCTTSALAAQLADNVRHAAACALTRSPHADAKRLLLSMWNDPYFGVRIDVVQACGRMDTAESLELLKKMTADTNEHVRGEAERILKLRVEAKPVGGGAK